MSAPNNPVLANGFQEWPYWSNQWDAVIESDGADGYQLKVSGGGGGGGDASAANQITQIDAANYANSDLDKIVTNTLNAVTAANQIDADVVVLHNDNISMSGQLAAANTLLGSINTSDAATSGNTNICRLNFVSCVAATPVTIPAKSVVTSAITNAGALAVIANISGLLDIEKALILGGIAAPYMNRGSLNTIAIHNVTPNFTGTIFYVN